jgi:hypothetical protein
MGTIARDGGAVVSDIITTITAPAPAAFSPSASIAELQTQLRAAIAIGDASTRTAGDLILHLVEHHNQSVRTIAANIGKSKSWVGAVMKWARSGYVGVPFAEKINPPKPLLALPAPHPGNREPADCPGPGQVSPPDEPALAAPPDPSNPDPQDSADWMRQLHAGADDAEQADQDDQQNAGDDQQDEAEADQPIDPPIDQTRLLDLLKQVAAGIIGTERDEDGNRVRRRLEDCSVELYDAIDAVSDLINDLYYIGQNSDAVREALAARKKAEEEQKAAAEQADIEASKAAEPALRERAERLGCTLRRRKDDFYLKEPNKRHSYARTLYLTTQRLDDLERDAQNPAEAA